jgi:hypothetical protein
MIGGEGELMRSPYDPRPIHKWPWDFFTVVNLKRATEAIQREIEANYEFPPPSPRTKQSAEGLNRWREWIKVKRAERRSQEEKGVHKKYPWEEVLPLGKVFVYDYKYQGLALMEIRTGVLSDVMSAKSNNPEKHEKIFKK